MEAMVSGLPCICSDIRENRDLISEPEGDILIKREESDEWCDAINEICIKDWNQIDRYILNVIHHFSYELVNRKMYEIY